MKVKILYFAQLRDATGVGEQTVELDRPVSIKDFIRDFLQQPIFEKYKDLPFLYAINGEFAKPEQLIEERATLAILPPVAGG